MFLPQLRKIFLDLAASIETGTTELEKLKDQAFTPQEGEDTVKRLEGVESLKAIRADLAQTLCLQLMAAELTLVELAEAEFGLMLACPPDRRELIEVPEIPFTPMQKVPVS